jgi:tetratricopeptide (TPR) repeat protein
LVGVILATTKHKDVLPLFPELKSQLELVVEEQELSSTLLALQMQLLLSLNTLEIEKNLREEIIPEMMKHVKNKTKDLKGNFDLSEDFLNEQLLNPEWESDGAASKLGEKMRALSEMQHKGADIMLGSFKMLKQSYPFFSVAANWFYPYTTSHPEFNGKPTLPDTFQQMFARGMMCESDKYSLHLMFTNMSQMQDAMSQQLSAALGGAGEGNWGNTPQTLTPQEELVAAIRLYVQDIYRYFKLFRHLDTMADPFLDDVLFLKYAVCQSIFANEDLQSDLANFTFKEGFWAYALELYKTLPETAVHHQKIGYSLQQLGHLEEALTHYEKANLLQEGSTWTLRQLGNGFRKLGRYAEALRYYEELEQAQPDDEKLLLALAECYLETKQYAQAFDKLFKADYLYPNGRLALRALAWCSFLTEKYDKATDYYNKILQQNPISADCLNAGHNAWVQGRVVDALTYYRQSLSLTKCDMVPSDFFEKDKAILHDKGITEYDLSLMLDALA